MDFFKQRARQILIEQATGDIGYRESDSEDKAYEGAPMAMKICYQQLKSVIKRPAVSYTASTQDKPHYMKMTFAMNRNAAPNAKILQMQSMMGSLKTMGQESRALVPKENAQSHSDMTLLR